GGAGGRAGVAEEVEHVDLAAGGAGGLDAGGAPFPVDGLLGEETGVLEAGGRDAEGQPERLIANGPVVGQGTLEFPTAAALVAAVVEAVPVFPRGAAAFGPDDLRVGTHEGVRAPTFLFHAVAAVEQLVVFPTIGGDQCGAFNVGGAHACRGNAGAGGVSSVEQVASGG